MSIQAMTWAFSLQQLDPHKKIVLLSLADNANDEGYCWPSMDTIAKKSSMSKSTARRHIKSLETLGLLTKKIRVKTNGANGTNYFLLHVGAKPKEPEPGKEPLTPKTEQNEGCQIEPPTTIGVPPSDTPITEGVSKLCKGEGVRAVTPKPSIESPITTTTTSAREENDPALEIFNRGEPPPKKNPVAKPMTDDWEPDWPLLEAKLIRAGIPKQFASEQRDEFVLYWVGEGKQHPSWDAKFFNHLRHQYRRCQAQQARENQLQHALNEKNNTRVNMINHEKHTMEVSYAQRTAVTSENDSFRQRLEDTDW
ncbi:helix-turn-helix domain-containing protein [Zooshikella marina]|uniref:DnaT-like ssDNA-binding domain-containing protein n=1 Tax=Zooshikella ganghwensis TaxID=202772 RepID=UPI001BAF8D98|nr:DnaT-like ssDNA-binding domain-containing protein [Zooshikella ganghwensis]MBU2708950.1 helix-turn-helix domain-containing protein [Zooshikella ganghwensis]